MVRVKYDSGFDTLTNRPKLEALLVEKGLPVRIGIAFMRRWALTFADGSEYMLPQPFAWDRRNITAVLTEPKSVSP